jgi:hypothetical protein
LTPDSNLLPKQPWALAYNISARAHRKYNPNSSSTVYDLRFSWWWLRRMPPSGMLRHVALVRTDVSKEHITSIIRVTRIAKLGTALAVPSHQSTVHSHMV